MNKQYHHKKGYKAQSRAVSSLESLLVNIAHLFRNSRSKPAVLAVPVVCAVVFLSAFAWNPVSGASVESPDAPLTSEEAPAETLRGARHVVSVISIDEDAETETAAEAASVAAVSEVELVDAVGLYVDDELVAVVKTEDEIQRVLTMFMAARATSPEAEVSFVQDIRTTRGEYPAEQLTDSGVLKELLFDGEVILTLQEIVEEAYDEPIAFETEISYDDEEYEDFVHVARPGVEGVAKVTDRVVYINGIEMERTNLSRTQFTAPVTELVTQGTMERPDGSTPGEASGSFCWPTPTINIITTYFEERWGSFHGALDISGSGCTGAPIVASDAGVVTWAGDKGNGYGYYIIIDHGNGFETLYAHCNELYVSTGDLVAKGELIAAVGSTGNSTGAHLHFEVLCYGSKVNPLNYVTY